ncbi:hypothetical protein D9M68_983040 [compost metagenome]
MLPSLEPVRSATSLTDMWTTSRGFFTMKSAMRWPTGPSDDQRVSMRASTAETGTSDASAAGAAAALPPVDLDVRGVLLRFMGRELTRPRWRFHARGWPGTCGVFYIRPRLIRNWLPCGDPPPPHLS